MKISLDWVKEYVALPDDLAPDDIAYDLTMSTVEVESVDHLGETLSGLIVARVDEVAKHPQADRLVVAKCDLGDKQVDVVCGATNVVEGMCVALAPPGTEVFLGGDSERTTIQAAKVRGVQSEGMICSPGEIGLTDLFPCGEKEILDLTSFDAEPGAAIVDVLGLDDVILEIDNKSLTNRPDLWGHYGIARELSAIYDLKLKRIAPLKLGDIKPKKRKISQVPECRRFTETKISGVSAEPSPFWLRSRLARVGQRPINLLVDLTNYVMLAVGQPTHAFDASRVTGKVTVRFATKKDKLRLLDQSEPVLKKVDLVVADDESPISLAGVMGGDGHSVLEDTTDIIFECANFDAYTIRHSATRLGIRTESSSRFEKALDPELVMTGVSMFVSMLKKLQPSATVTAFCDDYRKPFEPQSTDVPLEFLDWRLGINMPPAEMAGYLKRLGFGIRKKKSALVVTPPSWRSTGDITLPEDIVEEIARLHGYEKFTFSAPNVALTEAVKQPRYLIERHVKEFLASRGSMQEVFGYPWIQDQYLEAAGVEKSDCLEMASPPAPDECRLQPSLIPALLKAASDNERFFKEFRLFQLTRVFRAGNTKKSKKSEDRLPGQPKLVSGVFVGTDAQTLFRDAKGVLDGLARSLRIDALTYTTTNGVVWGERDLQMEVSSDGNMLGHLAVVARPARMKADIKHAHLVAFELELESLLGLEQKPHLYKQISEFPHVEYDISLVFDFGTPWSEVEGAIQDVNSLITQVDFVDEYHGKGIDDGKKSLTMRLTLRSGEGTLTSQECDRVVAEVVSLLGDRFGAVQRT